jgi:hypothetical protein
MIENKRSVRCLAWKSNKDDSWFCPKCTKIIIKNAFENHKNLQENDKFKDGIGYV